MRTTSWSLPESLHEHIDLVHPTTMFRGGLQAKAATFRTLDKAPGEAAVISIPSPSPSAVNPSCNTTITPTCLLQLYNATQYTVQSATKGNKIAISSYLGNPIWLSHVTHAKALSRTIREHQGSYAVLHIAATRGCRLQLHRHVYQRYFTYLYFVTPW